MTKKLPQWQINVNAIARRNRAKTHCKRNHKLTPQNTIRKKDGRRQCRTCANDAKIDYQRGWQRTLRANTKHPAHGTKLGANVGCKCVRCRLVRNERKRKQRARRKERERMSQLGFSKVLEWLRAERKEYQPTKFDYEKTDGMRMDQWDFNYADQQFSSYIQRLGVFPPDSLQFAQAALKLAATAVALCEHIADVHPLPKPGVPSGTLEDWYINDSTSSS